MVNYKLQNLFLFIIFLAASQLSYSQFYFFGRNKVQYENFEWKVIHTEHFDIYYYNEMIEIAKIGAAYAEESYSNLKIEFNEIITRKIPLIFYNTHNHFQQTNTTPGFIPEGVGGFFEFMKGRVVIPYMGNISQFKHVIKHELVHVFMTGKIYRIMADHRLNIDALPPLWFVEGLAEYYSTKIDAQAEMILRDAVLNNYFVGIKDLFSIYGTFLMYKEGQAFLEFAAEKYGKEKIMLFIDNFYTYTDFNKVIEYVIGKSIEEIDKEWLGYLKKKYYPMLEKNSLLSYSSKLITKEGFNFSPVYFKDIEKEYFYYLANLNGYSSLYRIEIKENWKKYSEPELMLQGEREEIFESFHLFQPSLAISKNGMIAFVSKTGSTDALHFYSAKENKILFTFQRDYLISISSPSFSIQGDKLIFQAVDQKGFSDVYVLNLSSKNETRLTNDYYDDKDPIFINENEIIFSSDRTSGINQKKYNLFRYNLNEHQIIYQTNIDADCSLPKLSVDQSKIFFVCDKLGTNNIWQLELDSRNIIQQTNFATSVLNYDIIDSSKIVLSGFDNYSVKLYLYECKQSDAGEKLKMHFNNLEGKWEAEQIAIQSEKENVRYERTYTLDYAQSQITTDPIFGTRGGAVLSLSDLFGDDNYFFLIYNTAEVQSDLLSSFNIALSRINLSKRTNYGYGIFNFSGRRYDIRESDEYFYERSFGGYFLLNFPLSKFKRIEVSATIANSDKEVITGVIERKALLLSNTLSYVIDNSLWGPSGPLDGIRFRLLLGYTSDVKYSNVNFYSFIIDYRHYFRLAFRSALAFRTSLFYNDGKEARRYFMGGSWDLRGWNRWSIRGEKLWFSSLELRFPLIDEVQIKFPFFGLGFFGIRGAAFFDVGNAWDKKYLETLGSVGAGIRFNLFGIIVFRYDVGKKIENNMKQFQPGLFYQFFFGWDF